MSPRTPFIELFIELTCTERCGDDRHLFRFIFSPEDAAEISDLKTFTRELMRDVEKDLDTKLDGSRSPRYGPAKNL